MTQPVHLTMIGLNLLAGAGLLALLGVLAWVSWGVVRSRATTQHHLMRTARQRLLPASWVLLCVFVATGLYGEAHSSSWGLPHAWDVGAAGANRAYVLLALGAYLFLIQIVLGLFALSGGMAGGLVAQPNRGARRGGGYDVAAALLSTLLLGATLFTVAAMGAVGYLRMLGSAVS